MKPRDIPARKQQTISSAEPATLETDGGHSALRLVRPHVHLAVFATALVVRLIFQAGIVGLDAPPGDDAALYDSVAANVARGGPYRDSDGYSSRRAPAFTFVLAGVYAIAGHSWPAARLAQAVIGALTCSVLLVLGASWLRAPIGLTAALLCSVFPYAVFWSGMLVTEPLCALLTTASIWALVGAGQDLRRTALWSCLCALAALTRPNMGLLLVLGLPWLLLRCPGRRLTRAVVAVGVFCLALAPWTIRNYRVHGRLVPITTMGGIVLWQGNNPEVSRDPDLRGRSLPGDPARGSAVPEADQDRFFLRRTAQFVRDSPSEIPRLVASKIVRLWNPFPQLESAPARRLASLSLLVVLALFSSGLVVAWVTRDGRIVPLLIPAIAVTLTAAIYWADARIRAPADPVILLVSAYGLHGLLESRRAGAPGPRPPLL